MHLIQTKICITEDSRLLPNGVSWSQGEAPSSPLLRLILLEIVILD